MTWNDPTSHVPTAPFDAPAPIGPAQTPPATGDAKPKKRSKWVSVGVPVAAAVFAFALGSGAGSSGAQTELADLRTDQTSLTKQVETAKSTAQDSRKQLAAVETKLDERETQGTKLTEQAEAQTKKITELTTANSKLTSENGKLQARVTELESATSAPAPLAAQTPRADAPAPSTVYFKNCAAARAAGAAPVHRGDPGYGAHLDRDGDGIGCE